MIKIKDNTIKSGYNGFWVKNEYHYIEYEFKTNSNCSKFDIKYIIDNFLKEEGYTINFENIVWFGNEDIIYYDFDDKYSIEIYSNSENDFILYFVIKEFDNFDNLFELLILQYYYNQITKRINAEILGGKE